MTGYNPQFVEREITPGPASEEIPLKATIAKQTTYQITVSQEALTELDKILVFFHQQTHPTHLRKTDQFAHYLLNVIRNGSS